MISNLCAPRAWRLSILALFIWATANILFLFFAPSASKPLFEPVERSVALGSERGFIDKTVVDEAGQVHRYVVFAPYSMTTDDRLPLMLYLNGQGKNGSDGVAPLIDGIAPAIWERTYSFPFVVVWPQCPTDGSWSGDGRPAAMALEVMRKTAMEYHTDPNRVYLSGLSSGGNGAWAIAADHPDEFAAVVPISASTSQDVLQKIAGAHLPVWMFSVAEDAGVGAEARSNYQALLGMRQSPHHSELRSEVGGRMDLHDAWSFAYRNCALYRWLSAQNRTQRHKETQSFELIDATQYLSTIEPVRQLARLEASSGILETESIQDQDDSRNSTLSEIKLDGLAELHLDFHPAQGANRISIGFLDTTGGEALTGSALEMSLDGLSCGGLHSWPGGQCIYAFLPESEHAFTPGRWNDLRLKFSHGRMFAELNGWPLFDAEKWIPPLTDSRIGFSATGGALEIRNVRVLRTKVTTTSNVKLDTEAESFWSQRSDPALSILKPVEMAQIRDAWRRREEAFPTVEIRWTHRDANAVAASTFRSTVDSSSRGCEESQLVFTPSRMNYSTAWLNSRIDLGRMTGFSGKPSQNDFLAALNSRFTLPRKPDECGMRFQIGINSEARRDEVFHVNQRGRLGLVFDRANPWQDRIGELEDQFWRGPTLAFRPFSKLSVDCDFDKSRILPNSFCVDGVRCHLVEERTSNRNDSFTRRFWVDPERDFLILRMSAAKNGLLREQIDVKYEINSANQWLPVAWTAVSKPSPASSNSYRYFSDNDKLFDVASAKVLDCKLNAKDNKTREADFRRQAIVFDQKKNEWFQQVSPANRRKLLPDEIEAITFAGNQTTGGIGWVNTLIGVGIVVLCAGWALVRRLRRRR